MLCIGVYTAIVAYLEIEVWQLKLKSTTAMHSLLGLVISIMLVFRTNTAYERWWEGRRKWGELVNNSRNLMLKINAFVNDEEAKIKIGKLISSYSFVLKEHLRGKISIEKLNLAPLMSLVQLNKEGHQPNQVAASIYKEIKLLYKNDKLTGNQLLFINEEIRSFTNICGACERIKILPFHFRITFLLINSCLFIL